MPPGNQLNFDALPDVPQIARLKGVVTRLWDREDVKAVWVGGSLASGTADRHSDVDLFVAVEAGALEQWYDPDLEALFGQPVLGHQFSRFAETFFVHHLILASGEIFDLHIQSVDHALSRARRLILGCREEALQAALAQKLDTTPLPPLPATAATIQQLIESYWFNVYKHPKVLARDLELVAWVGLRLLQFVPLRLFYIQVTGEDCGDLSQATIHAMTPVARVLRQKFGDEVLAIVGQPLRSRREIRAAIDRLNDDVGRLGRQLAEKHSFDYPDRLEALVLRRWADFKEEELRREKQDHSLSR